MLIIIIKITTQLIIMTTTVNSKIIMVEINVLK